MANINQFKANLVGAGPRNNRFEVYIPRAGNKIQFLCKTASLPGQQIEAQEIKYKGLTVKLAGDRTFENWTTGVYNDNNFSIRSAVEKWMDEIVPTNASNGTVGYEYMADRASVSQMDRADNIIATYEFFNFWPSATSVMELDSAGADAIQDFTVTWQYSHFERSK